MPTCQTRNRLADEFAIAARLYYEAVVALTFDHPPISMGAYLRLRAGAADARRYADARRIAFEKHVDSHLCVGHELVEDRRAGLALVYPGKPA
jgi:hypothetical protein